MITEEFIYQDDLDLVLQRAPVLRGSPYRVYRQYPAEMSERRRSLVPVMNQFWNDGAHVKLVRDRLFVNGVLYDQSDDHWLDESTEAMEVASDPQNDDVRSDVSGTQHTG